MTPPTGYTEDALIERPAIALLAELGWKTVNAYHEFDRGASPLGREAKAEVVLKVRLREALLRHNMEVSVEATVNEKLKGTVAQKLMVLVRLNRTRMDYLERFQAMIGAYNAGSLNAEEFFQQLVAFAQSLNEEEQRGLGEQLDEEELALFDLLTKPQIDMSETDREKVKATARELLTTLKASKLVLDWRKRQQARAEVRVTIEKLLDQGLPRIYTPVLFEQKTTAVFQHVYDAYYGAGRSVYAAA